jgi:hypothetical protein
MIYCVMVVFLCFVLLSASRGDVHLADADVFSVASVCIDCQIGDTYWCESSGLPAETFFLNPLYLQSVQIHSVNGVKLLEA